MPSVTIGLDVGGTRTKLAVVAATGAPSAAVTVFPTPKGDLAAFVDTVQNVVHRALAGAGRRPVDVVGCGVGVPGFVDASRVSAVWESLSFLAGEALEPALAAALGMPVVLDNDARCAALGEARFGGHGAKRLLSLTLGTGLGVALVLDGVLQERNSATHLAGHIPLRPGAAACFCGFSGCFESCVASARLGPDPARTLASCSDRDLLEAWLDDLAYGLNASIHLYAPDVVVLGGGLAKSLERHLPRLQRSLFATPFEGYRVDLRVSSLAERAGALGAAVLGTRPPVHAREPQEKE